MCNAFSCIVMKDGTVFWKFAVDSHDKILELNNIPDNTADAERVAFCRVEISPENKNYLKPDKWVFKVDQKPVPVWFEEFHEKLCWKAFREWKQKLDSILVYKPIIYPLGIEHPEITEEHIALLREWASVWDSVRDSVRYSVWDSVGYSVRDSVRAYTGSFFVLPRAAWKYTENVHTEEYPFEPAAKLWEMGLVPSFDGKTWRLHGGKDAKVLWEGKI